MCVSSQFYQLAFVSFNDVTRKESFFGSMLAWLQISWAAGKLFLSCNVPNPLKHHQEYWHGVCVLSATHQHCVAVKLPFNQPWLVRNDLHFVQFKNKSSKVKAATDRPVKDKTTVHLNRWIHLHGMASINSNCERALNALYNMEGLINTFTTLSQGLETKDNHLRTIGLKQGPPTFKLRAATCVPINAKGY